MSNINFPKDIYHFLITSFYDEDDLNRRLVFVEIRETDNLQRLSIKLLIIFPSNMFNAMALQFSEKKLQVKL